jgi:hypothetical protein
MIAAVMEPWSKATLHSLQGSIAPNVHQRNLETSLLDAGSKDCLYCLQALKYLSQAFLANYLP